MTSVPRTVLAQTGQAYAYEEEILTSQINQINPHFADFLFKETK